MKLEINIEPYLFSDHEEADTHTFLGTKHASLTEKAVVLVVEDAKVFKLVVPKTI